MKIKAHIFAVETNGESMMVNAQGTAEKAPDWMESMARFTVTIPATKTNQKAFHLGREITIEIKPR